MFNCIITDLHLICAKLLNSISSYVTIKMYFFKLYSAIVFTFLILKLFIRCLLVGVGVTEGLWLGISLSYKWKQIGVFSFEESSMHVYELFST